MNETRSSGLRTNGHRRVLVHGLIGGLAGTAAVSALSALERRRRGRPAVSDPAVMAARLAPRLLGRRLGRGELRLAGALLRWPYGVTWATAVALTPLPRACPGALVGAALGAVVWSFELVALPLSGATPPLRRWDREELWTGLLNTAAYGLVASEVLRGLASRGGR